MLGGLKRHLFLAHGTTASFNTKHMQFEKDSITYEKWKIYRKGRISSNSGRCLQKTLNSVQSSFFMSGALQSQSCCYAVNGTKMWKYLLCHRLLGEVDKPMLKTGYSRFTQRWFISDSLSNKHKGFSRYWWKIAWQKWRRFEFDDKIGFRGFAGHRFISDDSLSDETPPVLYIWSIISWSFFC